MKEHLFVVIDKSVCTVLTQTNLSPINALCTVKCLTFNHYLDLHLLYYWLQKEPCGQAICMISPTVHCM